MDNNTSHAEERSRAAMRRQQLIQEALDPNQRATLWNICHLAAEQYREHAKEFRKVVEVLQNGGRVAMFADGKPGIRAAERLVEQFERQAEEAEKSMELFE